MNITHNLAEKLVARAVGAAAAAAAPALLLVGAGTAHADDVTYDPWTPGTDLVAHIQDTSGKDSICTYNSIGPAIFGDNRPAYHSAPFRLPANANFPLTISPAVSTGATWYIAVECPGNFTPTTVFGGDNHYQF